MPKTKSKIILVDRHKALQEWPKILEANGAEIIRAKDTRDARRKFAEDSASFIFLDRETFNHLSSPHHITQQLSLKEYVEKKLQDFVKKFKATSGSNLYETMMREVEKPLLSMVLKETNGNQVHASQILGMNRNTLRKKIKELNIPIDS